MTDAKQLGKQDTACHMTRMSKDDSRAPPPSPTPPAATPDGDAVPPRPAREIGGPKGPEPTRYGDWEIGGRCSDF
jgi:hypothetical protein